MPQRPPQLQGDGTPSAPVIGMNDILWQVNKDLVDKEVQSAATYSYLWLADQMGHVALGLIVAFATVLVSWLIPCLDSLWLQLAIGVVAFAGFETNAYIQSQRRALLMFRLDRVLLAWNAVTAAGYMILSHVQGVMVLRWAQEKVDFGWMILAVVGTTLIGIAVAPWWIRQKINWQRAGLPYLARLAETRITPAETAAAIPPLIDELIHTDFHAAIKQCLIVIGPPETGKTAFATAIGTEYAFAGKKVRYVSFDKLCQMYVIRKGGGDGDDLGPQNIGYWRWTDSEVLIIDDLSAGLPEDDYLTPNEFRKIMADQLQGLAELLKRRHTVWIVGSGFACRPDWIREIRNVVAPPDGLLLELVPFVVS